MKKIIVITVVALICFLIAWCVFFNKNYANLESTKLIETDPSPIILKDKDEQKAADEKQKLFKEQRERELEERTEKMKRLTAKKNVDFEFWGQVVDHIGKPLEGVKIEYSVSKPRLIWDTNTEVGHTMTDANGLFTIIDKGRAFSVESFEKEGYIKTNGQSRSFGASDQKSNKHKPIRFTLIKKTLRQKLVESQQRFKLKWNGIPIYYDIDTGKLGDSGEIKITALRGEIKGEARDALYDWSFKVEVPKGGITESENNDTFLAPELGYKNSWEYGHVSTDRNWVNARNFIYLFFKLENGNYGYLQLDFIADPKWKLNGGIKSYFNPSGSRVLE
jgi:DNA-binding transcriptional regulator YhcF (GntR family)